MTWVSETFFKDQKIQLQNRLMAATGIVQTLNFSYRNCVLTLWISGRKRKLWLQVQQDWSNAGLQLTFLYFSDIQVQQDWIPWSKSTESIVKGHLLGKFQKVGSKETWSTSQVEIEQTYTLPGSWFIIISLVFNIRSSQFASITHS